MTLSTASLCLPRLHRSTLFTVIRSFSLSRGCFERLYVGESSHVTVYQAKSRYSEPEHPLRMLGRGTREYTDESRTPISHELVRFMMNDKLVDQATAKAGDSERMFLELLGRKPTENERAAIQRMAATDGDVTWALLNTREFMFRP